MSTKKPKKDIEGVKGSQYQFAGTPFNGTSAKVYMLIHNIPYMQLKNADSQSAPGSVIFLGTLKAISISTFRDKTQVRALGVVNPKGFVRGTRTIAGTMVFQELNIATINRIRNTYGLINNADRNVSNDAFQFMLDDQLPRFDLFISVKTELRDSAHAILYGVEMFSNGQSISVNSLSVDEIVKYQAEAYEPLDFDGKTEKQGNTDLLVSPKQRTAFDLFREVVSNKNKKEALRSYMRNIKGKNPFL